MWIYTSTPLCVFIACAGIIFYKRSYRYRTLQVSEVMSLSLSLSLSRSFFFKTTRLYICQQDLF